MHLAQGIFNSIQTLMRSVKNTKVAPSHVLKFNFFKYLYNREMYEHSTNEWAN